jgi:hypothetical protein
MSMALIDEEAVPAVFEAYAPPVRRALLRLRALILETAAATQGVGAIEETLKWGQPSYLTSETGSGTTIRIDQVKRAPGRIALYVHCQTSLIETFRRHYPQELQFEGKRAILLDAARPLPEPALRHCIALALTYHRRKAGRHEDKSKRRGPP